MNNLFGMKREKERVGKSKKEKGSLFGSEYVDREGGGGST